MPRCPSWALPRLSRPASWLLRCASPETSPFSSSWPLRFWPRATPWRSSSAQQTISRPRPAFSRQACLRQRSLPRPSSKPRLSALAFSRRPRFSSPSSSQPRASGPLISSATPPSLPRALPPQTLPPIQPCRFRQSWLQRELPSFEPASSSFRRSLWCPPLAQCTHSQSLRTRTGTARHRVRQARCSVAPWGTATYGPMPPESRSCTPSPLSRSKGIAVNKNQHWEK